MSTTHKAGTTVYNIHGAAGCYVARAANGHIVEPIYEDDDEPHYAEPQTWREVFAKPPTEKLHAEVAKLDEEIAVRRRELNGIQSEVYRLNSEEKARADRIKRHEALAELDRYLAGEITHYVASHQYYPQVEIIPIGKTIEEYGSASGYGLLRLMPCKNWNGKVHFEVTFKAPSPQYSRTETVIPCCGEEAALATAAEVMRQKVAEYEALPVARRSYITQLYGSCERFGVAVPDKLRAEQAEYEHLVLTEALEKKRKEVAEAEAALSRAAAELGKQQP